MNLFAPFNSDGYKLAHAMMYSEGTTMVYSNLTPRSDRIYRSSCTRYYDGKLAVVGLQGALIEIVENWQKFFNMDKGIAIAKFKFLCDNYLGKDAISVDNLAKLHDLGYLPLEIKTLDEGSKVNMGIPILTVRNTVAHAYWLVNFLETTISDMTWKTATAATIAGEYRAMLKDFAIKTGTPLSLVDYQIHDFSSRGMSGMEDAARTGFGHIAAGNLGTDALGAILYAQEYYSAGDFVACSVPATEHAVATSNILRIEQEILSGDYQHIDDEQRHIHSQMFAGDEDIRFIAEIMFAYELIQKFPNGFLSYVMDSFDFWTVLSKGMVYLKDVILARQATEVAPGKFVCRPDSGIPEDVICGTVRNFDRIEQAEDVLSDEHYNTVDDVTGDMCTGAEEISTIVYITSEDKYYRVTSTYEYNRYDKRYYYIDEHDTTSVEINTSEVSPEDKGAIRVLWEIFGGTITETGHKLLDEHIGLIYGDSITTKRALTILERLEANGFASGNVVLGVGSYTYQCVTRDTFGFAVKATYTEVNGVGIPIFKDPKTDSKKKSAKGLLQVSKDPSSNELVLNNDVDWLSEQDSFLSTRFIDGALCNMTTIGQIRAALA